MTKNQDSEGFGEALTLLGRAFTAIADAEAAFPEAKALFGLTDEQWQDAIEEQPHDDAPQD
ncbi:MAG: hypothetical protein AUG49_18920 [Catenulispora sp. 13_1_20CM_3_70_7]|nr:MAG: hypothetical protein AUG49_18920 [Catenulispora sp. 13_1_20CM_3_70_7]